MPWRKPRKHVDRARDVAHSEEEALERKAEHEEEDQATELAALDGASIVEAATGSIDEPRVASDLAAKLGEAVAGLELRSSDAAASAPSSLPDHWRAGIGRDLGPATPTRSGSRRRFAAAASDTTSEAAAPESGVDLEVEIARGLRVKNPVLTASGTFGQGVEYAELIDVSRLGAIVNKGTTPHARPGNPQYRIAETPSGILNSIGLENPGAAAVAKRYGRAWAELGVPVIVKLTPNAPDVVAVALACEEAGADGLTAINTVLGMRIDTEKRRPVLGTGSGGLSGPAIRPIAVHITYQVAQAVSIPIIGAGGVTSAEDALEFLMAGASAVQVGTATFADPLAPIKIVEGLARYVRENGLASIREVIGAAQRKRPNEPDTEYRE